jgi:glycine betaine/proline transport system ATP-binding protein
LLPHKTVIENVMSGLQIRDTTRQGLLPHKTVLENIAKVLRFQGASKSEAFDQAEKQVELVGLKGFENQYPSQLSGGMQQRVGLARALATDADVLLMDEAFSALDPLIRNDMQDQLIQIQKELNRTIVFITHDLDEALRIGDHIAILKDGELRQVGTPEEILIAPADDYVSRFVKDVNRGRVVTIGSIASEYPTVDLPSATYSDAVAKLKAAESDTCYVLEKGKPVGAVTSKMTENGRDLSGKITSADQLDPILTVDSETVLEDMLTLAVNSDVPVAVLNDAGVLVGGVPRRTVMSALVRRDGEDAPAEPS